MKRKLAGILATDVVGYRRLMEQEEPGILAALISHREELAEPKITVECCLAHLTQSAVARWLVYWSTGVRLREPWIS